MYDSQPTYRPTQYQGRPDSRGRPDYLPGAAPQAFGWNPSVYDQPGYNAFPSPAAAYSSGPEGGYQAVPPQQPYVDPSVYAQQQQHQAGYPSPYGAPQGNAPYGTQGPTPYPAAQLQSQQHLQPGQSEAAVTQQQQPQQQTVQPQAQTAQQQPVQQQQSGPPYVYDPNGTYEDPNVQAWAKYYAQGGHDTAGSVYFISIPGVTDGPAQPAGPGSQKNLQPAQQTPAVGQSNAGLGNTGSQTFGQGGTEGHQQLPGPGQAAPSELAGYTGQRAEGGAPPQPHPHSPQSFPVGQFVTTMNGYPGAGPASPHSANSAPPPWVQAQHGPTSSPPHSPNQQHQVQTYHRQNSISESPTLPLPGTSPLHPHHSHQQAAAAQPPYSPTVGTYGEPLPDPRMQSASPHGMDNAPGYSQFQSLPNQFAGMNVSNDGSQSPRAGQQQYQAPQGVGAPA